MKQLSHPQIVTCYAYSFSNNQIKMALDFASYGSLQRVLQDVGSEALAPVLQLSWTLDIIGASLAILL